jgi:FtsX-like permease family
VERVTGGVMWAGMDGGAVLRAGGDEAAVMPRAFATGADAITPVVADGRAAETDEEIVLDPAAADGMDLDVGDTVELVVPDPAWALASTIGVDVGSEEWPPRPTRYEIVGVGPLLSFGQPLPVAVLTLDGLNRLMRPTTSQWSDLAAQLPPADAARLEEVDLTALVRPQIAYVDVEGGARAAERLLGGVSAELVGFDDGRAVIEQLELVDLSRASRIPDVLGALFAIVSIGVAAVLVAGVTRGRRRDLAVLRALGLSNRQLRWSAVSQASLQVLLPAAVGIPLGVVVGQRVWLDYAESIGVVPSPAIDWFYLVAFVASVLVVANLVALVVAPRVARHPASALRTE